jgi:ribosomal protein L29
MKTYQEMSKEELTQELTALKAEYEKIKGMGLADWKKNLKMLKEKV